MVTGWDKQAVLDRIREKLISRGMADPLLGQHTTYHQAVLDGLERKLGNHYVSVEHQGLGGTGEVLKLISTGPHQPDGPPAHSTVCLKYPQPTLGQMDIISLSEVLDNEIEKLRSLHHQHIMPLLEASDLNLTDVEAISKADRRVPYYIMPFVDAIDLSEFIGQKKPTLNQLVFLLHQTAMAVNHIHNAGFVHLDIKPENVFIENYNSDDPSALLADFGFCKHIEKAGTSMTVVMGTQEYMHPKLLDLMKKRSDTNELRIRDQVPRKELDTRFDRYSMAMTIVNTLCLYFRHSESKSAPTPLLRALQFVAVRSSDGYANLLTSRDDQHQLMQPSLCNGDVANAFKYHDTDELVSNLASLLGSLPAGEVVSELIDVTPSICLPPGDHIPQSPRVIRTLDSTPVRRLNGVAQLSLCGHVYPGACHTRKEHSLGTYWVTTRLLRYLLRDEKNPLCSLLVSPRYQKLALLAALLHDVAHIPLMHEFDDSLRELSQERYTTEILDGRWGDRSFQKDIDDVCDLWGVTRLDLQILLGDKKYARLPEFSDKEERERWETLWDRADYELLRSIVDGAIDADKIDYLHRDATHAGVSFGREIDLERLARVMTVALWRDSIRTKSGWRVRCRLAAWRKGQAAAESVIEARHNMYSQVYGHKTVRASRAMLNYITWRWRLSVRYRDKSDKDATDDLFAYACGLGPPRDQQSSLFDGPALEKSWFLPKHRDNLPFAEANLIRWMASIAEDDAVKLMAECLIQRSLYKLVCEIDESKAKDFLDAAYPIDKKTKTRLTSKWSAQEWVDLTRMLCLQVHNFLGDPSRYLTQPLAEYSAQMPEVLLAVSIPKGMRTQKELVIVDDNSGATVSWARLGEMTQPDKGCMMGLEVEASPVYEIFGGREGYDNLTKTKVMLFAQPSLASALRAHLGEARVAEWLNNYNPDS